MTFIFLHLIYFIIYLLNFALAHVTLLMKNMELSLIRPFVDAKICTSYIVQQHALYLKI